LNTVTTKDQIDATLIKKLDIEYHREAAVIYDRDVTNYFHFYHVHSLHPWIRRLLGRYPNAQVADLGTGTGIVACTLSKFGCRVRAIDHSPDMLAIAIERARQAGVESRITFDLGDGEALPYADASFDGVTIQGVLHHLPENGPLLHEANRVLKTGGEIYISEPCSGSTWISRSLNKVLPALKRLLGLGVGSQNVSDHEAPISGPRLIAELERMGMKAEAEYLVNVGAVRYLPQFLRIWATLALSAPTRRRGGDIIFVVARKIAAPAP
jgi:ubiquinone/menaquinone biosynthesis C-methylase UbiE